VLALGSAATFSAHGIEDGIEFLRAKKKTKNQEPTELIDIRVGVISLIKRCFRGFERLASASFFISAVDPTTVASGGSIAQVGQVMSTLASYVSFAVETPPSR
jgi:hypothetical protein